MDACASIVYNINNFLTVNYFQYIKHIYRIMEIMTNIESCILNVNISHCIRHKYIILNLTGL